ncbi:MAG: hypothetical protein RL131_316 [Bacteroidota bacterium]|jgi:hypothetical protein
MYLIRDRNNNAVAYIVNNIIFNEDRSRVLGIVIGDCFYGRRKNVIGKLFNDRAYLVSGEIIGSIEVFSSGSKESVKKEYLQAAWEILSEIKDHTTHWIVPKKVWNNSPFSIHFEVN